MWSVGSAGKWADHWANFSPNALSLRGFPGLKILSQKCLFLKSLVFRELAENVGRVLNKLNPSFWVADLPKTIGRKAKGEGRKDRLFET